MKLGFIFGGQGTQTPQMGEGLIDYNKETKKVYELATKISGIDVIELSKNGTKEELIRPLNAQISIISFQVAILEILKNANINSIATSGLSLGEYASLYNAKVFDQENLFKLINHRSLLMERILSFNHKFKMLVIFGLEENQIDNYVNEFNMGKYKVAVANYNTFTQQVVAGLEENIKDFSAFLISKDEKVKQIPIEVSVPSHTKFLNPIKDLFMLVLVECVFQKKDQDFYSNYFAKKISDKNIREGLVEQLVNPTYMGKIISKMIEDGVDTFVEIAPKKILHRFVKEIAKKMNKEIKVINITSVKTCLEFIEKYKQG